MGVKVTPSIRYEVISATGLCVNPRCVAHDDIVARIWEYKNEAEESAYESGKITVEMVNGISRIRP